MHFGDGYYAPDGKNLRKAFLRAPLEFSRVSSGFGMRVHPIAQTWRAHKGIDYAAPAGTRVRAVGDGVVDFAGAQGRLRQRGDRCATTGQYATVYAHLSRIARGVKRGARVAQNDTIGFVGQTGWATGPHLHYEFQRRRRRRATRARSPCLRRTPVAGAASSPELPHPGRADDRALELADNARIAAALPADAFAACCTIR